MSDADSKPGLIIAERQGDGATIAITRGEDILGSIALDADALDDHIACLLLIRWMGMGNGMGSDGAKPRNPRLN